MKTTLTSQTSASPAAPSSASVEGSKPVTKRLISLDAFRGWTMFWIVGGGAIMTGLQALGHNPVIETWIGGERLSSARLASPSRLLE